MPEYTRHPASYRDPSGFVFRHDGLFYRQVNASYADHYLLLKDSGLYDKLTAKGLLLSHSEVETNYTESPDWFKTLLPEQLSFVSPPEEWSPAQLKDAALCTLTVTKMAIDHGMILKDAAPRNIQFPAGRPVLIDSLSFERYDASLPWIAYRQFCECFLYPLLLHHYQGAGTHRLISAWPEGIPAGVVSRMLPLRSRWRLRTWLHVFLPAKVHPKADAKPPLFNKTRLLHLLSNLEDIVRKLDSPASPVPGWSGYYDNGLLSRNYLEEKQTIFAAMIGSIEFTSALDLGANDGHFSRILAERRVRVIAAEADWQCVQKLYRNNVNTFPIQAVCMDIANPTPATGFDNRETSCFSDRAVSDLVVALALLHHLVLGRNIPLPMIAAYLARLTRRWLLIEFVPLTDERSVQLIRQKSGYPLPYDPEAFERQFSPYFSIEQKRVVPGTERILYLLKKAGV